MMRLSWFMLVGLAVLAAVASAQPGDDGAEPIVEDIGALPCCETDNGQCLPPEWQCVRATLDSDLGINGGQLVRRGTCGPHLEVLLRR